MDALQDRFGSIVWEAKSIKISPGTMYNTFCKCIIEFHIVDNLCNKLAEILAKQLLYQE